MRLLHRLNQYQRLWQPSAGAPQQVTVGELAERCFCSERHVRTPVSYTHLVGRGFIMGNAMPQLKAELPHLPVIGDCRHQAVSHFLTRYLESYYNPQWVAANIGDIAPWQAEIARLVGRT